MTEQLVSRSREQIKRLGQLVGDLLDVSCLTTGQLSLHLEEVDLAEIVHEIAERARQEFHQRGCMLTVQSEGPIRGEWDRMRVGQVVTNLLTNSLKYGQGQPVSVLIEGDAQYGRIHVCDSGIGIAPDQQETIFRRFGRAVAERSYEGVGLGLWISRQIVEALRGTIRVQSDLGRGSTFMVELPRSGRPASRL
jgi:signal transduction histidine kinase